MSRWIRLRNAVSFNLRFLAIAIVLLNQTNPIYAHFSCWYFFSVMLHNAMLCVSNLLVDYLQLPEERTWTFEVNNFAMIFMGSYNVSVIDSHIANSNCRYFVNNSCQITYFLYKHNLLWWCITSSHAYNFQYFKQIKHLPTSMIIDNMAKVSTSWSKAPSWYQ